MSGLGSDGGTTGREPRTRKQQRRDELINTSIRASLKPSSASGAAVWTLVALALMWLLVGVNAGTDHSLTHNLAIRPRHTDGLIGIVTAPLIHADVSHLAANTLPFAALCWLTLWSSAKTFAIVTPAVWLGADAIDWITGPSHDHIVGVSGVVFGWMGYVLARAFYGRSIRSIAIAVVVVLVFSSTFTGLLPHLQSNVYWAGHLVGFIVGVGIAAALHKRSDGARSLAGRKPKPQAPP